MIDWFSKPEFKNPEVNSEEIVLWCECGTEQVAAKEAGEHEFRENRRVG